MYFSNVTVYQITRDIGLTAADAKEKLSNQLQEFQFTPCGSQDRKKMGWIPPLHAHDCTDFILANEGHILLTVKKEEKILPAANVKKRLDAKVKEIEKAEGRPVKKKEKDQLKDDIIMDLLPQCLTKETYLSGYISLDDMLLVIDTSSFPQAEEFSALLRKTMGSLPVVPLQGNTPHETTMTNWLKEKAHPEKFTIGNDAKLVSVLKEGGKAAFKDEDLFSDEVLAHIEADKMVTEIRLSLGETMSFTLNDSLQVKSIKWSDELKDKNADIDHEDVIARIDADYALMAGELDKMLSQLFKVMDVKRIWDHGAAAEEFVETVANAPGVESVTITSGDHSVTIKAGSV
ncbi:recombination-associated protein RdgC [Vibrio sp. 2026]|uniref:recombination-associated protein RdgC n=1 Tax=unclassified Vibrio TaxID=2614977 RepID=UPI002963D0E1|nr:MULTISPECIES: recombination-associated protein RdgC [unclassified Vibrio]MDG2839945.1 recombination-associated protein RdgC [Vibrio parahaemolyticus]MDW2121634.1 recombination-associated protein RdgC [Vibrio sp. 2026]MDW2210152.1 recombination-associated protein RdgC [Vibrio sp. 2025]HAV1337910.1 recombination-associated protein RdgC [Vibrio parahaemolyticus]HAV1421235.1 recombination-associated protein RdgC [Vibrio parahaemolyticus]